MRPIALLFAAAAFALACAAAPAQPIFRPPIYGGGLHWAWVPYNPSVMHFGLTPEQAADRVRAWMQDPSLQLEVAGIATDRADDYLQADPWPTWEWELQYMLAGSDGKRYFVRIHPWVGLEWYDISADTDYSGDPELRLSDAQRQTVAEAFARARAPDLWGAEHAQQHYGRVCASYQGVAHPDRYSACSVHPETGALISSVLLDPGVPPVSVTPDVSAEAARALAIPFLLQSGQYTAVAPSGEGGRVQELRLHSDVQTLTHRLTWSVPLAGTRDNPPDPDGIWYEHDVWVDAHTGEPFYIESYLGGNAPKSVRQAVRARKGGPPLPQLLRMLVGPREVQSAMPPLGIDGRAYLWAGWLRSPLVRGDGTRVAYRAGVLRVTRGDRGWVFPVRLRAPGGHRASVGGSEGLLRAGRCYLPLAAAAQVLPYRVRYEAAQRTVHLDPPARTGAGR